jgi:hypothetical protein
MDPRRFDALARSLVAPKTRRGFIGGLAALGAGLLGANAAEAQVSQAQCGNKICKNNPGVCVPGCVCCAYPNGNSHDLRSDHDDSRANDHDHCLPHDDHDHLRTGVLGRR